jgi:hypothetical protein
VRKTLNRALLRKVAAKLRGLRHEKHYDQSTYGQSNDCGTAACIAGWTVLLSGYRLPLPKTAAEAADVYAICIGPDGKRLKIHTVARGLLGLTANQAANLFDGGACSWPAEYSERFDDALYPVKGETPKERPSRIAADLLDAIADGKVSL